MGEAPRCEQHEQRRINNLVGEVADVGDLRSVGEADEWTKRNPQRQKYCREEKAADQRIRIDGSADCGALYRG
jgi:hypothetical protein